MGWTGACMQENVRAVSFVSQIDGMKPHDSPRDCLLCSGWGLTVLQEWSLLIFKISRCEVPLIAIIHESMPSGFNVLCLGCLLWGFSPPFAPMVSLPPVDCPSPSSPFSFRPCLCPSYYLCFSTLAVEVLFCQSWVIFWVIYTDVGVT